MKEYHTTIFEDNNEQIILYDCDPILNMTCSKTNCKYLKRGECSQTSKKEFARDYTNFSLEKKVSFFQKLFKRKKSSKPL